MENIAELFQLYILVCSSDFVMMMMMMMHMHWIFDNFHFIHSFHHEQDVFNGQCSFIKRVIVVVYMYRLVCGWRYM